MTQIKPLDPEYAKKNSVYIPTDEEVELDLNDLFEHVSWVAEDEHDKQNRKNAIRIAYKRGYLRAIQNEYSTSGT